MRVATNSFRRSGRWQGSKQTLGFSIDSVGDLVQRVNSGFAFSTLTKFQQRSGLPMPLIAQMLQIPQRTLARRKASGRLQPHESERLLRIATLFEKAVALFEGDLAGARLWLMRPLKALGNQEPLSYARTEVGAREVEHLIGRLEHGVFT
jgi:putative toxin-antitoxin system antitoxin component (TIGR02293 family)